MGLGKDDPTPQPPPLPGKDDKKDEKKAVEDAGGQ